MRINYNRNINVSFTNNSNVAIDVIILTFYSDQLVIDVETGIVTKYFFYNMVFFVRVFLIPVKRSYLHQSSPGQTEGLKVGCVGKNKVFIKPLALGWFAKVDNSFGYEKWT